MEYNYPFISLISSGIIFQQKAVLLYQESSYSDSKHRLAYIVSGIGSSIHDGKV